ncbi:MAG: alcohol dehydrogenase [Methanomassiliicoccales archaeon]|nr:MAG: alcohol dehydrogenase [Methanomassiliicoccales archaeon]
MRVAMYYNNNDIRLEEMPKPEIGSGELLVKVIASGVCGSDVMEWYRIKKAPLVLGHEIAGDIVEVGDGVTDYKEGDRVFVSHHVPCGECKYCLDDHGSCCDTLRTTNFDPGGFSEFVRIPQINVEKGTYRLPDEVSYEDGVFVEPLACVVRGQRFAEVEAGDTVLVLGSGIVGLLHIKLAKARGAGKIIATDISDYRLDAARKSGADEVIDGREDVPEKVRELNDGRLADVVIVSTGAVPAIKQSLRSVDSGGTILFFAPTDPGTEIPIPFNELWREEITMVSSYAGCPEDINEVIELLRSGSVKVQDLITHRLGLADTQSGFQLVAKAEDSIKVVIEPWK